MITNLFIMSGVTRHWHNLPENMAENQRHWKQTTTGRKNIPITEFEKQSKKTKKSKEPQSLEEALTEN